jgi:endonuclease-8
LPEGDTIFRAARTLNAALAGKIVRRFVTVLAPLARVDDQEPIAGRTIEQVVPVGKHLIIDFSGGLHLRTHMRMNGSWHIYRPGESWQRPRGDMRIRIATEEFEAVGFSIPVAEFTSARTLGKHPELRRLGPDILSDAFDETDALSRLRAGGAAAIADALLNQRILAGLGNVYKSEVLFLCRTDPFKAVRDLTDLELMAIVQTAHRVLTANVSESLPLMTTYSGFRRTTGRDDPKQRLWVYGRARLPCRRCATPIRVRKQGLDARLTYWCPGCQGSDA